MNKAQVVSGGENEKGRKEGRKEWTHVVAVCCARHHPRLEKETRRRDD